jgi:hypothetical protein
MSSIITYNLDGFHMRYYILFLLAAAVTFSACKDLGRVVQVIDDNDPPPPPPQVSFMNHVRPIFAANGCDNCHGGNGGLNVQTVAQLLQGGNHGPAIIPGNSAGSNLVRKLSPTPPFGDRMPQGGPYLPDATVQIIRDWIDQGAQNN